MKYVTRMIEKPIAEALRRGKSILLFGARQTGKTTLIKRLKHDLYLTFANPTVRLKYEKDPSLLVKEVEAMHDEIKRMPRMIIDEVQKIPAILDAIQFLIDEGKAQFVLTGSSARKLIHGPKVNLLPGRVVLFHLDPYSLQEQPIEDLEKSLVYGALPSISMIKEQDIQEQDLDSYVETYLEEEVRAEALVRNLGAFARFLELSASESGSIINLLKLSTEIGVSHTTIASYYQILEDCLITHRIEPITKSKTRKKLTKSQKYIFFDLGVRRVAAKEGVKLPKDKFGLLFEQFIGLELIKFAKQISSKMMLKFWRDPDGPEVDWVIEHNGIWVPIEVKWTETPSLKDAKHLNVFLSEYPNTRKGYVVCRCDRRLKLSENITAISWKELSVITDSLLE